MDAEAIADHARKLTRDGFVFRFSGMFLAVKEPESPEISRVRFTTKVVDFAAGEREEVPEPLGWEIFEIVKAPGNPYPDRISVGRARNCDIVMHDASVSKLHAHLRVRSGGYDLVDLESQNGTRVNGATITAHEPHGLAVGDEIHFGVVLAQFVDGGRLYDLLQFD
jgi:hypothetical protein